jgi:hypothetical protein
MGYRDSVNKAMTTISTAAAGLLMLPSRNYCRDSYELSTCVLTSYSVYAANSVE